MRDTSNAAMNNVMTVIKANPRSDILLIYDEVAWQLKHNGWDVDEYIPTSYYLGRSRAMLLARLLRSLTFRGVVNACRNCGFFLEGRRLRLGRLLDFLSFSKHLDARRSSAVFVLNQRHSAGSCHAARVRDIPIITHQHGDYYQQRAALAGPLRDIEGAHTIRIVWNEESKAVVEKLAPEGSCRVGGSFKHAAIQRNPRTAKTEPSVVFFETIFADGEKDHRVAEFSARILGSLHRALSRPTYVAAHPMRNSGLKRWREAPLRKYYAEGIEQWPFSRDAVEWAICSDSTALFDLVASGIPCLHLKREDSFLSLSDAYPGTLRADGDVVAQARDVIAHSDRTSFAMAQLAFLQEHKIGSPSGVDECFSDLLRELTCRTSGKY